MATPDSPATAPPSRRASDDLLRDRLPVWLFGAFVVVAFPVLLFGLGRYHWFMGDEWVVFVERRDLSLDSLFEPHNVHLAAVPIAVYIALWTVFGVDSYRPYQAVVIAAHLAICVLLFVIARRAGARPWLAASAAAVLVLFGPGYQNIIWAFQIGFAAAVAGGLAQIVLADHDGPFDRRDALGVVAGIVSVMSTGVGVTMALVTGVAVLLRRGWRIALAHTVPLAVVYGGWRMIARPTSQDGQPSVSQLAEWVWSSYLGTFSAVGHFRVVALAVAATLIAGLAMAWAPAFGRGPGAAERRRDVARRLALPTGMLVGAMAFPVTTGLARWTSGIVGARQSRYVYVIAALALPAIAVAAETLARRWRVLAPVFVVLLLVPIPTYLGEFEQEFLAGPYMRERERILTTAVRMPFARDVPRDVRPVPDPYDGNLTIGFLLDAYDQGRLAPSTYPISPSTEQEMRIRLGLAQRHATETDPCEAQPGPVDVDLEKGDTLQFSSRVRVWAVEEGEVTSRPVEFNAWNGQELTAELDDLSVRIGPAPGTLGVQVCRAG